MNFVFPTRFCSTYCQLFPSACENNSLCKLFGGKQYALRVIWQLLILVDVIGYDRSTGKCCPIRQMKLLKFSNRKVLLVFPKRFLCFEIFEDLRFESESARYFSDFTRFQRCPWFYNLGQYQPVSPNLQHAFIFSPRAWITRNELIPRSRSIRKICQ